MINLDAPKWRLIYTDSESLSGVAPICPQQTDPKVHLLPDEIEADHCGVYDCCPGPHIECWNPRAARAVLESLNAASAEVCS